jgi:aspartate/methionine/tyrosine aminotransferase
MKLASFQPVFNLSHRLFRPSSTFRKMPPAPELRRFSSSGTSTASTTPSGDEEESATRRICSPRATSAVKLLPVYLADARAVETFCEAVPDGALQLGVAESLILEDLIMPVLKDWKMMDANVGPDCIYYQPTPGRPGLRQAMAAYIEETVGLEKGRLEMDGLVLGAGCNAVLENLCFCLADPGDAVLIPTPYYAAFEFDLTARAGMYVQPVTTTEYHSPEEGASTASRISPEQYYPNRAALDAAFQKSSDEGHTPRILLLSHPQNPLGVCYPPETIKECIDWCREREVHLISDEIYAGSIHGAKEANFQSALKLADTEPGGLGPFVHWVYALSKDFALSGLRVGAAYTENEEIRVPLQKLNDLCQISSTTQVWTEQMMKRPSDEGDELWTTSFRRENHRRLAERRDVLTSCLDDCQIPYLAPTAGLFIWIDLTEFLPTDSTLSMAAQERQLYMEMVHEFGLLLTPGWSMRNEQPGFFRCVFTAATAEEFSLALVRFKNFVDTKRQ